MKIAIPDDYQNVVRSLECFHLLAGHDVTITTDLNPNLETRAAQLHDAEALVIIRERTPITEALLDHLPHLRFIAQTGRGMPHIDLAACTRHGVAVSAGTGSPYAPAELTWALILAAMRCIPQEIEAIKTGRWQTTLGLGLQGKTLGIFGYGKIGSIVAGYGRAFGMRVLVWGREGSLQRAEADGFETAVSQQQLFVQSDVLSLHLKMTGETRGMVTAADLNAMKSSSLLVNTSRAALVVEGALERALKLGRPGMAAVDVYESEPVLDHPLLHMDNVICTPHLGYVEKDSYELYFGTAFEQVVAFAAGNPIDVINPEALNVSRGLHTES